jgi:glycosyltransferase involved in cell wall biosynthesis
MNRTSPPAARDATAPRVIVAHNRYRSGQPSGENAAVAEEIAALRAAGAEVLALLPGSDDIPGLPPLRRLLLAAGPVIDPYAVRELGRLIAAFRPDVLHLHNVFPRLSPWLVRTARARGVPVVQTVHNYRHSCVSGFRYRDGGPCDSCVGRRLPLPAVRHACYRGSRAQSAAMAAGQVAHRRTWRLVDRYIALTPLLRAELIRLGVPADRIVLRPTAVADPGQPAPPGRDVLFVGRLDQAKGADLLLDAFTQADPPPATRLRIVGEGPLGGELSRRVAGRPDVDLVGGLDPAGVARELRSAGLVAIPSRWYEGQPRVYAEALAHARPVLATDSGALAGLDELGVGWSVPARPAALAAALTVLHDRETLARTGDAARTRYQLVHTPDRAIDSLLAVYRQVIRVVRTGG